MIRIGHGYDVHAFADDRKCIIGGVDIPYPTVDRISTTWIDGYKDVEEKIYEEIKKLV